MKLKWLPTFCTVANLGSGVLSLMFTIHGQYMAAFVLIMIAALWDVLDGLLARLLNATSEFGKQLDSLADVISFGLSPAFLIFIPNLQQGHWIGQVAAVLFPICGALRLARFNTSASSKIFTGLPITAAGVILAVISILDNYVGPGIMIFMMYLLSCMMVSRIRFPSFKKMTQ